MRVKITNWKKVSAGTLIVGAIFAFLILQTKAATESDAIAVRIMPNTNHDSIETWYASQGYKGSPQSLIVDGYEAIRDGRTVFVNAANLDTLNKKIYTNIYLISYNQESEEKTLDILGQLVSHWKFNNNVTTPGYCSISTVNCQADADCGSGYICSNYSGTLNSSNNYTDSSHGIFASNKGKCILKNARTCTIDSDCPINLFCDSLKASSIRDVKRLGQLNQINNAILSFKNSYGAYPSLQSGTYIPGATMSVWPSWKDALWTQLGLSQLLVDPVNTLGYCDGYDAKTCWNNTSNTFVSSDLFLPNGSYAFVYKAAKNGLNYLLCSVFETKNLGYDTIDKKITTNFCSVSNAYSGMGANTAPTVVSSFTEGETGKEFNGYIKVKDAEGDLISWKLSVNTPTPWLNGGWSSGPNLIPVLQDTGDANQKKVHAPKAGNPGTYQMDLTLTDSRGAATTTKVNIVISAANKPLIEAEDTTYFVDPIIPLNYTFYLQGSNSVPTYTIKPTGPNFVNASISDFAKHSTTITSVGLNKIKVDLSFTVLTSIKMTQNNTVPFRITATADGTTATKDVNINFKVEKPVLDFQCESVSRTGQAYPISGGACLLGKSKNGNHDITYKILSGPAGLLTSTSNGDVYLSASIINFFAATTSSVRISATNEYGASSEKSFDLKINTFCGDDLKQKPNTEGRGGLYNDGVEECDGIAGVWTSTTTMSMKPDTQYACTSGLNIKTPYPILDNNRCVFKSPTEGGGFCGDGYCQKTIKDTNGNTVDMESCSNCSQDCGVCVCTPSCGANLCGSDGCGGSCGECGTGDVCTNGSCCPTKAGIQVCADNGHNTYFNGNLVSNGSNWENVEEADATVIAGKNVMAINAIDWGGVWGFSATLNQGSCRSMTTDDLANWKCINASSTSVNLTNWNTVNYDDSGWRSPIVTGVKGIRPGNYLTYQQIWSPDANQANTKVYCRYTFSTFDNIDLACQPKCAGKCAGSDGCGGLCPDTCTLPATCGGSGVLNVCGEADQFDCIPQCANKCGGPDGCGGVCDENPCEPNQKCIAPLYKNCKTLLIDATQNGGTDWAQY